jgi:CubicO group peptidase (beta-lactamase class C family)
MRQFRVLYREFLFRVVDLDILTPQGDIGKLLGQFAALLLVVSLWLWPFVGIVASVSSVPEIGLVGAWIAEHFLIATTMLIVGLLAVLSWDALFPDRRDVLVLSPLPLHALTLFAAKIAAVATALSLVVVCFNLFTSLLAPLEFATAPALPPPHYDAAMAPLEAPDLKPILDRDLQPAFAAPNGALMPGTGAGVTVGIVKHGKRRIFAYGTAKQDSIYEIGSTSKTFTALLLARMLAEHRVRLDEPVRDLLPSGIVPKPTGAEITLLDLATHHSGLPVMPDNLPFAEFAARGADYHAANLYAYLAKHGLEKPAKPFYRYSNLDYGLLGVALANRAVTTYENLLQDEITRPLGMSDTGLALTAEQREHRIPSYDPRHMPVPLWNVDALAGAVAIRSTAGDMLNYVEAQLHPEQLPANLRTLRDALVLSHEVRADAAPGYRIALAWFFDPAFSIYLHGGSKAGYTSQAFFDPQGDYAGIVLFNEALPAGFTDLLSQHIRERLRGKPAISLTPQVVSSKGGIAAAIRSFAVYWFTVVAAGIFLFCTVLSVQGVAQLLPRQLFLRFSSVFQMVFFVLLLAVYFLQPGISNGDTLTDNQETLGWLPSYWFFGLFQQLNGPIRPELAALSRRAWIGLGAALCGTALAYLICYYRTLRKIAEQPDILPARRFHWLPRFGSGFETAVGQFSVRSLLRSRQHRVILSFYWGATLGLALLFSNAPALREQRLGDLWYQGNASLLMASAMIICASAVGTRVVFAMPLAPRANWLFRVMPLPPLPQCLPAIRRSLYGLALAPMWLALAVLFFRLWPFRIAARHLLILAFIGIIAAEFSLAGFPKIPFACAYQPGKSRFHMIGGTFGAFLFLMYKGARWERSALASPLLYAVTVVALALAAILLRRRTKAQAHSEGASLQFDDPPEPAILSLGLHRDGVLPIDH